MKYIISQEQLDSIVFRYLDLKKLIQIEGGDSVYFVKSEHNEYAQIRYDKKDGWCYVYWKLVDEISSFFYLEKTDTKEVIGRWVENTLQMKVTRTGQPRGTFTGLLRIPSK
jgi:hypothetical protein